MGWGSEHALGIGMEIGEKLFGIGIGMGETGIGPTLAGINSADE